jgi:hypothetical protein
VSDLADAFLIWFARFVIVSLVALVASGLISRKLRNDRNKASALSKGDRANVVQTPGTAA